MKSKRIFEFFEQIENYTNNGNEFEKEMYKKFIKYYKKVWLNSNYNTFYLSTETDL